MNVPPPPPRSRVQSADQPCVAPYEVNELSLLKNVCAVHNPQTNAAPSKQRTPIRR